MERYLNLGEIHIEVVFRCPSTSCMWEIKTRKRVRLWRIMQMELQQSKGQWKLLENRTHANKKGEMAAREQDPARILERPIKSSLQLQPLSA